MKKIFSAIIIGILSGCALAHQATLDNYVNSANAAEEACWQDKELGKYKKWQQVADCYDSDAKPLRMQAAYNLTDLVELTYIKYRAVFINLDKGKISKNQAAQKLSEIKTSMINLAMQRQAAAAQVQAAQAQQSAASAAWYNAIQSNHNANRPRYCSTYMNNTTCY